MAQGNSSNANRYKGKDIDRDGDGSVNDAQTLQGNQPSDLGNTIDGKRIVENSSGNIETALPWFEDANSPFDSGGSESVTASLNQSYSNVYVIVKASGTEQIDVRITVNGDTGSNYDAYLTGGNDDTGRENWQIGQVPDDGTPTYVGFYLTNGDDGIYIKADLGTKGVDFAMISGVNENLAKQKISSITADVPYGEVENMKVFGVDM